MYQKSLTINLAIKDGSFESHQDYIRCSPFEGKLPNIPEVSNLAWNTSIHGTVNGIILFLNVRVFQQSLLLPFMNLYPIF